MICALSETPKTGFVADKANLILTINLYLNVLIYIATYFSFTGFVIVDHSFIPSELPQVSASLVDYQSLVVIGGVSAKYPLVKVHGTYTS